MAVEEREELARELNEFGYRETDDPDEADRRNYYKVERWDSTEQHVFQLLHASKDLSRAQAVFMSETKHRPCGRYTCARVSASSSVGRRIPSSRRVCTTITWGRPRPEVAVTYKPATLSGGRTFDDRLRGGGSA